MYKILIIEDDRDYASFLQERLRIIGYEVDMVHTATQGLEFLAIRKYDLLIIDFSLETVNGNRIPTTAKRLNPAIATIVLTDKVSSELEFASMTLNVDLYLEKNKSIKVILVYVAQLLERSDSLYVDTLLLSESESLELNLRLGTAKKNESPVNLTPIEFSILQCFLENKNTVLSRSKIIRYVWGVYIIEDNRKLDAHIRNIRAKLDIIAIVSVRGIGYKWSE